MRIVRSVVIEILKDQAMLIKETTKFLGQVNVNSGGNSPSRTNLMPSITSSGRMLSGTLPSLALSDRIFYNCLLGSMISIYGEIDWVAKIYVARRKAE